MKYKFESKISYWSVTVSSERYPVMKKKTKIKVTGMTVDLSKEYEKSELIQILSNRDRPANSRYGLLQAKYLLTMTHRLWA